MIVSPYQLCLRGADRRGFTPAMWRAQMVAGQPVRHGAVAGHNTKGRRKWLTRGEGKGK